MFFCTKHHDRVRTKKVEMNGRCAAHAGPGASNGMRHDRRFGHAKTRAAIGFGHCDAKPAALGDGFDEGFWKYPIGIPCKPIGIIEWLANFLDGRANG